MSKVSAEIHETKGNIFADLGLPDAEAHFLKAQIVAELYRLVSARKLTQIKAGSVMGITQPEVSRLFKGNFREYSVERLMEFLTGFGQDVDIIVKPRRRAGARGQISFKPVMASLRTGLAFPSHFREVYVSGVLRQDSLRRTGAWWHED